MYFLFRLGYACCYNKQMIDNAFLEARGQSASCSGQLVTKIEASFRGGGGGGENKFPACPLLLILGFKYDTYKNYITTVDYIEKRNVNVSIGVKKHAFIYIYRTRNIVNVMTATNRHTGRVSLMLRMAQIYNKTHVILMRHS